MEPSSFEDGDVLASTCVVHRLPLQWSRPHLRTETIDEQSEEFLERWLQWSRPHLRTETRQKQSENERAFNASMEPSSFEDGDQNNERQYYSVTFASMEPSSFEDGDVMATLTPAYGRD